MTLATNTSKLVKFPLTGAKDFNSNGIGTYRNLRSEFVSVLVTQMIMLDVMYNYIKEGDEGLALKDGFGPVKISDLGTVSKTKLSHLILMLVLLIAARMRLTPF